MLNIPVGSFYYDGDNKVYRGNKYEPDFLIEPTYNGSRVATKRSVEYLTEAGYRAYVELKERKDAEQKALALKKANKRKAIAKRK